MDNYMDLENQHISYAHDGKVMLCTGIVLFVVLLIILFFHSYARFLFRNRRLRDIQRRAQHLLSVSSGHTPVTKVASKGLDSSVIKTIPTVIFSTGSHFPPLECAVCLSEFENDEKARVLPRCNHTFHVDCIDMWFYSHSNCPLCRAPVIQTDMPVNPPNVLEQTVVPVAEEAGSDHPGEDIEMNSSSGFSASSSSSTNSPSSSSISPSTLKMERCPMQTLEIVTMGIPVEVPSGEDRLTGMADAGSSNRILNLKRILERIVL